MFRSQILNFHIWPVFRQNLRFREFTGQFLGGKDHGKLENVKQTFSRPIDTLVGLPEPFALQVLSQFFGWTSWQNLHPLTQ